METGAGVALSRDQRIREVLEAANELRGHLKVHEEFAHRDSRSVYHARFMSTPQIAPRFKLGDRVRIVRDDVPKRTAVISRIDTSASIPRYELDFGSGPLLKLWESDLAIADYGETRTAAI